MMLFGSGYVFKSEGRPECRRVGCIEVARRGSGGFAALPRRLRRAFAEHGSVELGSDQRGATATSSISVVVMFVGVR